MALNQEEIREFREKMNKLYRELRRIGVVCRKNFTCCGTCGHHAMPPNTSYVFYHAQEADSLREGRDHCYLAHTINPEHLHRVQTIVRKYGSNWDGDDTSTIIIPFHTS